MADASKPNSEWERDLNEYYLILNVGDKALRDKLLERFEAGKSETYASAVEAEAIKRFKQSAAGNVSKRNVEEVRHIEKNTYSGVQTNDAAPHSVDVSKSLQPEKEVIRKVDYAIEKHTHQDVRTSNDLVESISRRVFELMKEEADAVKETEESRAFWLNSYIRAYKSAEESDVECDKHSFGKPCPKYLMEQNTRRNKYFRDLEKNLFDMGMFDVINEAEQMIQAEKEGHKTLQNLQNMMAEEREFDKQDITDRVHNHVREAVNTIREQHRQDLEFIYLQINQEVSGIVNSALYQNRVIQEDSFERSLEKYFENNRQYTDAALSAVSDRIIRSASGPIPPRQANESAFDFHSRLLVYKNHGVQVVPRAEDENLLRYYVRLYAQANARTPIAPRNENETFISYLHRIMVSK